MKIALFIPCLVNQMMPEVAIATLTLLEKLGHEVIFPKGQTCCGQPMTNSGCFDEAKNTTLKLLNAFKGVDCDAIVCPAASCLVAAKENFHEFDGSQEAQEVISNALIKWKRYWATLLGSRLSILLVLMNVVVLAARLRLMKARCRPKWVKIKLKLMRQLGLSMSWGLILHACCI